jgi:hypothetical protein
VTKTVLSSRKTARREQALQGKDAGIAPFELEVQDGM